MRNSFTRRAGLAATAMGVVLAMPAYAQEAQAGYNDDAIVVTARRIEENLQDVPISITVFNQDQLDQRNITNSTDLATYTPSLSVNNRYGPEKASFVIRGFSQELNTQPTVTVYFADVAAPRLSSNITSGNGAGPGDLFDLQNVQVLKGPQGTLFGRNTTGGAILLVPKKPTGEYEGYIEAGYGNYDSIRAQGVLNLPLSDSIKLRVGVDHMNRDGYIKNRSGVGPDDFGDVNYVSARVSLLVDMAENVENYTIFKYSENDTHLTVPKLVYCDTSVNNFLCTSQLAREADFGWYEVENGTPDPFVKGRNWQLINTTTWDVNDNLTVKNIFSYGESREAYSFSLDGDLSFNADGNPQTFIQTHPGPDKPQGNQWTLSEELQIQGNAADGRLIWQAGGYYEESKPKGGPGGQQQWTTIFGSCSDIYAGICERGNLLAAENTYNFTNYGFYAQATYDITEQFAITGGFRYNWDKVRTDASNTAITYDLFGPGTGVAVFCRRTPTPGGVGGLDLATNQGCNRTFETKSSEPTWLINLDYKPTPDVLVYAKWARGYKGGGVNEANVGTETWDPEKVDLYELGAKTTIRGANVRGTFNITGFWNDFSNQQASVFIPSCDPTGGGANGCANFGINGIQNIGKSRMRGVEVDASFTFFDSLRLDIGYAYLDTEVREVSVPVCDDTLFACDQASFFADPGARLAFAPKNRITATATYTLPLDESMGTLSVSATFTHTDNQFHLNNSAAPFAAGNVPFDAGIIPATDLLNLNLDWKRVGGSMFDLGLFATNVTDEKYWVAAANGYSFFQGEFVQLGVPRMYGFRVRLNFD